MKTGGYLILWLTIFVVGFLRADQALPWLVHQLDPLPPAWVAMLSWLPLGAVMVALAIVKPAERGDFRPELAAVAALPGLIVAAQLPLIVHGGKVSDAYTAAATTDTGTAFSGGFLWGAGTVVLWGVIFAFSRRSFSNPKRAFAIGALVASLFGLTLSVVTL